MRCAEIWRLLCGRGARGNVPRGTSKGGAEGLRLGRRSRCNQDGYASVCRRRLNGLMTQVADGAVIDRRGGMMMPNHPERRPYQERDERYRECQSPDFSLIRHF
jgi:hypothetical protein